MRSAYLGGGQPAGQEEPSSLTERETGEEAENFPNYFLTSPSPARGDTAGPGDVSKIKKKNNINIISNLLS